MFSVHSLCTVAVIWGLTAVAAFGQGTITGNITDGENGEPLRGASVLVVGTKKGNYTDPKGSYRIAGVPAGTYALRVSYVGYEPRVIDSVVVRKNETTTINAVLTTKAGTTVVVTADRATDNAAAMMVQRQKASTVSDGVAKEEIQKLPDSDAGQSLKRVTGVTLVDGKYVFVRGVSDRYSNTTLNGASLTTTEPDKKSFAFDMFPSELLENVNIAKSFTPDLPGNFVGGLVQLNTVDFPSGFGVKLSLGAGANDYVTNHAGQFLTYPGGGTDWLGKDDGSRAMPANMPDASTFLELRRQVQAENLSQSEDRTATDTWLGLARGFNGNNWKREQSTAPFAGKGSLSLTNVFEIGEESRLGLVAAANYGNGYQLNRMTRTGIQADGQSQLFDYAGTVATRSTNAGALLNLALKPGSQSTISIKNTYSLQSDDESVYQYGREYTQSQLRKNLAFQFVEKELFSTQLGGEHNIAVASNLLVDWKLGYSQSQRDEPDVRRLRFQRDLFSDAGAPMEAAVAIGSVTSQGLGSNAGRFFSNMVEFGRTAGLNAALSIDNVKIKVGGLHEFKNRSFRARSFTIVQSSVSEVPYDLLTFSDDSSVIPDPSALFADSNYAFNKLALAEDSRLRDAYTAEEELYAGYAMVDVPFSIGAMPVRVITGARLEQSGQRLNSYNDQDQLVNVNLDVTDILPSFNVLLTPVADFNVRLAATQTLTRPSLREFAPFAFFDFQSQSTVRGNPELTRALVQNYDLRLEWFPGVGEVLSTSVFYKNFLNAIEETVDPSSAELIRSFRNAQGPAKTYGVEFEARKSLGFVTDVLRNFLVTFNLSLINSEVSVQQGANITDTRQMWGQSPYSLNAGIFYQNVETGTSVNLAYNIAGKRIVQVAQLGAYVVPERYAADGPHVYELPRDIVDLSVSQAIGALDVKLSCRDILNQTLRWEQLGQTVATNLRGRNFSLSFGYRFN